MRPNTRETIKDEGPGIKILAINLGSTSTKIAYAEDGQLKFKESINHTPEEFEDCEGFYEQEPIRIARIRENLKSHGVQLEDLDAIIARGGMLQPLPVGVFEVNEALVKQIMSGEYGVHPSSMGAEIVYDLTRGTNVLALTADVPSSDELLPVARYTGLKEMLRRTMTQTLNARAVVREWAATQGKTYDDVNVITVGLGGGINIIAHCHGRMIDTNNSVDGEGCFSTNRCLTVPIDKLIRECYSGEYTYEEMMWHVNGSAGLVAYLGTFDMFEIEKRIDEGDEYAAEVIDAMCYQIAKDTGGFATTMYGDVDAIILTGGMARCKYVADGVKKRIKFLAPVIIRPGELELEALLENGYKAVTGELPIQEFVAAADDREAIARIDDIWKDRDWKLER